MKARCWIILMASGPMIANSAAGEPAAGDAAAKFPDKPVRMIIPFPPGGGTDTLGRPIAQKLTERWHQQVVVDNRGGAGGIIGSELTAKSPPDGYTIMLGTNGTHGINQSLYRRLPYDTLGNFTPITMVALTPNILVLHPSVSARSVKELIALAKAKPGQLNYGSAGNGSNPHLAGELFKSMAGVNITHVPYKGAGPALTDLLAGHMQVMFANAPVALPQIKAAKLRALATTSEKRSRLSALSDFPTIAESGVPGYEADTWYGMFAPAGVPPALLKTLSTDVAAVLLLPEMKNRFANEGADVVGNSAEQFSRIVKSEIAKWAKVIKETGIQAD
jgi:tripartite-type tricarboxylate transporter receptor subunit TctC